MTYAGTFVCVLVVFTVRAGLTVCLCGALTNHTKCLQKLLVLQTHHVISGLQKLLNLLYQACGPYDGRMSSISMADCHEARPVFGRLLMYAKSNIVSR